MSSQVPRFILGQIGNSARQIGLESSNATHLTEIPTSETSARTPNKLFWRGESNFHTARDNRTRRRWKGTLPLYSESDSSPAEETPIGEIVGSQFNRHGSRVIFLIGTSREERWSLPFYAQMNANPPHRHQSAVGGKGSSDSQDKGTSLPSLSSMIFICLFPYPLLREQK